MEETVSLGALTTLVQKKIKKKTLVKVIWNDQEKMTLLITPNMKINSFIYEEEKGYLFYDNTGKEIDYEIPCVIPEKLLVDGKIALEQIQVNGQILSKEDLAYLRDL
ncbi:hypothetical protein D8M04_08145 [Oceanobacillus piezotolerans]|uniref:Uncharacterized protein n=1 Tax=Oceanobacillus piezotolerans TaxID=2448030 RepID=A0A498DH82_9BACI|nr:hypothetical protein [Oceanobacillus piezotolerans]RLL44845.1 hypothetical protein D8M04_08145 [Oceanobacillus piezotolerans]